MLHRTANLKQWLIYYRKCPALGPKKMIMRCSHVTRSELAQWPKAVHRLKMTFLVAKLQHLWAPGRNELVLQWVEVHSNLPMRSSQTKKIGQSSACLSVLPQPEKSKSVSKKKRIGSRKGRRREANRNLSWTANRYTQCSPNVPRNASLMNLGITRTSQRVPNACKVNTLTLLIDLFLL